MLNSAAVAFADFFRALASVAQTVNFHVTILVGRQVWHLGILGLETCGIVAGMVTPFTFSPVPGECGSLSVPFEMFQVLELILLGMHRRMEPRLDGPWKMEIGQELTESNL